MKPKLIAIGGVPGTGKSTLIKKVLESQTFEHNQKLRALITASVSNDLIVLGDYSDPTSISQGTDRWSMAVQPEAEKFFLENKQNVIFEGDRIFNSKMLEYIIALDKYDVLVLVLEAPELLLTQRYKDRGSEQSEKFLTGRKTKYDNVKGNSNLDNVLRVVENTTEYELNTNFQGIMQFLEDGHVAEFFKKVERNDFSSMFE